MVLICNLLYENMSDRAGYQRAAAAPMGCSWRVTRRWRRESQAASYPPRRQRMTGRITRMIPLALLIASFCALAGQPAGRVHAQTCSNTIRDSKQGIVGCVQLHAGLVIAHVKSNGTQTFDVDLRTQDPAGKPLSQDPNAYKTYYQLYSVDGRVDGSAAVMLKT